MYETHSILQKWSISYDLHVTINCIVSSLVFILFATCRGTSFSVLFFKFSFNLCCEANQQPNRFLFCFKSWFTRREKQQIRLKSLYIIIFCFCFVQVGNSKVLWINATTCCTPVHFVFLHCFASFFVLPVAKYNIL